MIVIVATDGPSNKRGAFAMTLSSGLTANTFIGIYDLHAKPALTDCVWLVPGTWDVDAD